MKIRRLACLGAAGDRAGTESADWIARERPDGIRQVTIED